MEEMTMPNRTPITSNVVALLSDAKYRARVLFMTDGHLCEETEAPVLKLMGEALDEAQAADDARIEAIYALNFGLEEPPSLWHARKRRERQQLSDSPSIA